MPTCLYVPVRNPGNTTGPFFDMHSYGYSVDNGCDDRQAASFLTACLLKAGLLHTIRVISLDIVVFFLRICRSLYQWQCEPSACILNLAWWLGAVPYHSTEKSITMLKIVVHDLREKLRALDLSRPCSTGCAFTSLYRGRSVFIAIP